MKLDTVKQIARQRGLQAKNMKKAEIIRAIQRDEGNTPCYNTDASSSCGQENCLWRDDCV